MFNAITTRSLIKIGSVLTRTSNNLLKFLSSKLNAKKKFKSFSKNAITFALYFFFLINYACIMLKNN